MLSTLIFSIFCFLLQSFQVTNSLLLTTSDTFDKFQYLQCSPSFSSKYVLTWMMTSSLIRELHKGHFLNFLNMGDFVCSFCYRVVLLKYNLCCTNLLALTDVSVLAVGGGFLTPGRNEHHFP